MAGRRAPGTWGIEAGNDLFFRCPGFLQEQCKPVDMWVFRGFQLPEVKIKNFSCLSCGL